MKTSHLTLAAFLLASVPASHARPVCAPYDVEGITLSGKVVLRTFFGPPNYGENPETDARETQALLQLDQPLCTLASEERDEPAERNQRLVTLVPMGGLSLKQYAGKHVSVQGSLYHADNGHHRTPVLIAIRQAPVVDR
ncbi:MAG: DUF4431 domain-containing protein [Azonexus sp.]